MHLRRKNRGHDWRLAPSALLGHSKHWPKLRLGKLKVLKIEIALDIGSRVRTPHGSKVKSLFVIECDRAIIGMSCGRLRCVEV